MFTGCANIKDFGAYTTGVEVTQAKFNQIIVNKSKKYDVESIVGYPMRKQMLGGNEIWYYDFTKIRHIGANIDESTVFEFNKKGVVVKKYKTAGGNGGNPLLNRSK